jgi:hypothetical protein
VIFRKSLARKISKILFWLKEIPRWLTEISSLKTLRWVIGVRIMLQVPAHLLKSRGKIWEPGTISIRQNSNKSLSRMIGQVLRVSTREISVNISQKYKKWILPLSRPKVDYINWMRKLKELTGIHLDSRKIKSIR